MARGGTRCAGSAATTRSFAWRGTRRSSPAAATGRWSSAGSRRPARSSATSRGRKNTRATSTSWASRCTGRIWPAWRPPRSSPRGWSLPGQRPACRSVAVWWSVAGGGRDEAGTRSARNSDETQWIFAKPSLVSFMLALRCIVTFYCIVYLRHKHPRCETIKTSAVRKKLHFTYKLFKDSVIPTLSPRKNTIRIRKTNHYLELSRLENRHLPFYFVALPANCTKHFCTFAHIRCSQGSGDRKLSVSAKVNKSRQSPSECSEPFSHAWARVSGCPRWTALRSKHDTIRVNLARSSVTIATALFAQSTKRTQ